MKRLAVLLSFIFLSPAVAHADGCPPSTCGTTSSAVPGSDLLVVRPNGQQGPLVGYAASTGAQRFRLPNGLLSADGTRFVTARRDVVSFWDVTQGGRLLQRWGFGHRAWPIAISADGYRIVLVEPSRRGVSNFAVFDAARARVVERVALRGAFQPEALSPDARRLYLIHWRKYDYVLQTYDFATRRLRATRLAEPDEKMTGTPWTAIATRDGRWLLTLYVEGSGGSFVHALDLRTGIAHCVDMPWRATQFTGPGTAALVLAPDQRRLYLANPLLGRVAVVDLAKLRVVRNVHFRKGDTTGFDYGIGPNGAITANGRALAFSGGGLLWLYDTAYGVVRGPFRASASVPPTTGVRAGITGLSFTKDGQRILALTSDRARASFDAASGRRLDPRPPAPLFAIRSGVTGPLVGYDANGGPRFFLPPGRASADGSRYFSALPDGFGTTSIQTYSPATGYRLRKHDVAGRWTLGAVSATGAKLALARHSNRTTWVRVLDTRSLRVVHAKTLRGVYTLDAVTDRGDKLFLIQHYRSGHYAVRALSFATGRLWTATLREKGVDEQPVMTGEAAGQVASKDGTWLLTLYLNTKEHKAFVHALNLRQAYAVCIDLPSPGHTIRKLRDYSLSLTPDGGVYAANGTLGVVARVDLRQQAITDSDRFAASRRSGGWSASALSRDGRTLYFSSGRSVWRYDTLFGKLRGPVATRAPVLGLAFSPNGRRVFAPRVDGGVAVLDAARGTVLSA